jgi:hypothetical protein
MSGISSHGKSMGSHGAASPRIDPCRYTPRKEAGQAQFNVAKLGAAEVNALETGALKILTNELSHASKP